MHRPRHLNTDICEAPIHVDNGTNINCYILFIIYTKIWEEELQELESSQYRVIEESIA